jgi:hypothetical protein
MQFLLIDKNSKGCLKMSTETREKPDEGGEEKSPIGGRDGASSPGEGSQDPINKSEGEPNCGLGDVEEKVAMQEKKLLRKVDLHLVPLIMLLYCFSFLDRYLPCTWHMDGAITD